MGQLPYGRAVRIETVVVSVWQANCYLIAGGRSEQCVVVDPGVTGSELVVARLNQMQWQPTAILCTHGHLDHVGAAATLAEVWDVPVYCATADQPMLLKPSAGLGQRLIPLIEQLLGADELARPRDLRDHEPFETAGLTITPYPAPGHTRGSTLLRLSDETQTVVLTGDVIFQGTIGRTDLPSADSDEMRASLRWLTTAFPDDTVLLPGHGPGTSLAAEKAHNPYLQPDFLKD